MAWRRSSDKPLSEPMMVSLLTHICVTLPQWVNRLKLLPFCRWHFHFPDDMLKCIFLTENVSISLQISLKFVPKAGLSNIPALVQIMAWHQPGDRPLSEPMMVTSIYVSFSLNESNVSDITAPLWEESTGGFPHKGLLMWTMLNKFSRWLVLSETMLLMWYYCKEAVFCSVINWWYSNTRTRQIWGIW